MLGNDKLDKEEDKERGGSKEESIAYAGVGVLDVAACTPGGLQGWIHACSRASFEVKRSSGVGLIRARMKDSTSPPTPCLANSSNGNESGQII